MALFENGIVQPTIENTIQNKEEFEQLMIACEIAEMDKETLEEFCERDGLGEYLVTEGKLKNKTLIRLSKKDDLSRRKKMAAYQMAIVLLLGKKKKRCSRNMDLRQKELPKKVKRNGCMEITKVRLVF